MLAVAFWLCWAWRRWAGSLPINDRQMQRPTCCRPIPELLPAMMAKVQQLDDERQAAKQAAAMNKMGQAAFFDPAVAFVTGPADAKQTLVEFYDYATALIAAPPCPR